MINFINFFFFDKMTRKKMNNDNNRYNNKIIWNTEKQKQLKTNQNN